VVVVFVLLLGGDVLDVLSAGEEGMEGELLVELLLFDGMRRLGCGRGGVIIVVCCCCCDVGGGG
jgi:hypothetical protein